MRTSRGGITPFTTLDGSEIRELMHPAIHSNSNQSLAEATILPGNATRLHRHLISEELYHVITGEGLMTLADQVFPIRGGDTICISPGTEHMLKNTADQDLVILCCCAPPYSHEDTQLL